MSSQAIAPPLSRAETTDRKRVTFEVQTPFFRELRRRVDTHFEALGISGQANAAAYIKTAVIIAWFVATYAVFLSGIESLGAVVLLATSTGFAVAGLGFCVQHDGGHGAYSQNKLVNQAMATVLDAIGGSSYVWRFKHNVFHHTYPNIDGVDEDISFAPLMRFAPSQPSHAYQRWQHLYIWLFYSLLVFKWHWWDDFENVARGRIGQQTFPRPHGMDMVTLVAGKLFVLTWALIIPTLVYNWRVALLYYVVTNMVAGITLACAFQLAHCVERVSWITLPDGDAAAQRVSWSEHQLATTVDFARQNRFVTWYLGGLNFQAVHHLFPKICHVHYPALSTIIEKTCSEFGVPYLTQPTFGSALASHYRWLRAMGR